MPTRSHWGWGWADRFPDAATRREIGSRAAALLGTDPPEPRDPVPLDAIAIRPPRVDVPRELAQFVTTDRVERIVHTYGRAFRDLVRGFRGEFASPPDAVALVGDEADVAAVLAWAARERLAVVPFGGGTSVVGGVEPIGGAGYGGVVTIDLRRLDRVLAIDRVSLAAHIQAGALGPALEAELAKEGLTLRHYPQSFEFSTLGGWIATRAGGHFATVYTHIDDLVESLRVVTPSGVVATRRFPASGAGPQPERLFLGSEGTLGVIVDAWVRVRPRPHYRASATVEFDDFAPAVAAVRAIAQSALFPSNCRLLDTREALTSGISSSGKNVLLLGFESADHSVGPWIERAVAIAAEHGGVCSGGPVVRDGRTRGADAAGEAWRSAFFEAPYLQSILVSLGVVADTFETACTWDRFDALHAEVVGSVREALLASCGNASVACRFTHVYPDGPAPYYTFLAQPKDGSDVLAIWELAKKAAGDALARGGATITHHHAVGRTHRPWYDRERPELFAHALRAAKKVLDPEGILNPGVLVDS